MSRWDDFGIFWEDIPQGRTRGARTLGPMPSIPETGWRPPRLEDLPNLRNMPWLGLDTETWDPELLQHGPGWARGIGHICGVSLAWQGGKTYLPIRHTVQPELNLDPRNVAEFLKYSLGGSQPKIGAHILYDFGWCAQEGIEINGPLLDCQYAEGLIDEDSRVALELLGEKYLFRGKKSEVLEDWIMSYYMPPKKYWRREIYRSPVTLVGPYAEDDADMPQQILVRQWPELVARGLTDLFDMECRSIRMLVAMRFAGISVDLEHAQLCRDQFQTRITDLNAQLKHIVGFEVNVNAGDSVAKAFNKFNLPYGHTRQGKPSFTAGHLKSIKHPVSQLVLGQRKLKKLISTFIDGYIFNAHVNGKVYCQFHPMVGEEGGARSGRYSSSTPNLQNIPIRTPEGREMRAIFTKDREHARYRSGDFSQIEYRLLAHYATGDASVPGSFEAADDVRLRYNNDPGLDYHKIVGALIRMYSNEDLIREIIKTLNFAIVYGVGKDHLAEMLAEHGISHAQALEIMALFHKAVPFARTTMNAVAKDVAVDGICRTLMNRQSHFDLWEPDDWGIKGIPLPYKDAFEEYGPNIRRAYLYAALNYKLQGSAADIMKKHTLTCWENGVFSYTGVPRLTCHDELGFSDPGNVPEDAWTHLVYTMEKTTQLRVPLVFDFKSGNNWKECKG